MTTIALMLSADAGDVSEKAKQAAADADREMCPICMEKLPNVGRGVLKQCVSFLSLMYLRRKINAHYLFPYKYHDPVLICRMHTSSHKRYSAY